MLSDKHLAMLRDGSGISLEVIQARGYRTVTDPKELAALGFAPGQCRVPGLLLPLWTPDGSNSLYVYRPDNPRVLEDKRKGKLLDGTYPNKVIKYEFPKGAGMRLDCPPVCRPMLTDPKVPLWITEGQKKADSLASRGLCAIALLGVWNFKGRNPQGGTTLLADFDYIAFKGRDVRIVFDSDVMLKPEVQKALARLTEHLQRKTAHVTAVYLPPAPDGGKQGVDDYLAAGHSVEELAALVTAPRPVPKAAAPIIELLDIAPPALRRPLVLIDGIAYAATWLYVRETLTETQNDKGEIIKHDPPIVRTEQRLFIVRADGVVFGDGGDKPLAELGLDVHLPEIPLADRLWSARGVIAYRNGQRPAPAHVFGRLVDLVNQFIDFDKSLAPQNDMAELVACYILGTWFLDAFNVIGFLWPNGDRGSGKTRLITLVAELSYLGTVILAGGSYAALRDLADYGACLAFDDAENLSDPRNSDPDKRALLLAGNRRGNSVPVKELTADRTWRTRYVSTFCPRLFSAIRLPDEVLGSRAIVIPLIKTLDRARANADPVKYSSWRHERQQLIDDLWALALAHLAELPDYERQVNERAELIGRNLEPWLALLSVAAWLSDRGLPGLFERMEAIAIHYQDERPSLQTGDLSRLVVLGLCKCAANDLKQKGITGIDGKYPPFTFRTETITQATVQVANEQEADIDADKITSRRVGRVLGKLRFKPDKAGGGKRQWIVTLDDLRRWAQVYAIPLDETLAVNALTPLTP